MAVQRIGIGFDKKNDPFKVSGSSFEFTITWLGTSDPSLTTNELQFNELTLKWEGTSSSNLLVGQLNFNELTLTWSGTSSPALTVT